MSDLPPIISCVDGNYEPNRPQEFVCQKTVALLVSKSGEMEVFGEDRKCNRILTNIPSLTLGGHSVSLLDNQLIIGAFSVTSDSWRYLSLRNPRGGILANSWTETKTLGTDGPVGHLSFVYGKDLVFLGGERRTQVILQNGRSENGEWNALRLTWKNGASFDEVPQDACLVKVNSYKFALLGGRDTSTDQMTPKVLMINMKEQSVEEIGSLAFARSRHACAIVSDPDFNAKNFVLVTGGLSDDSEAKDEIFHLTKRTSKPLDLFMNVQRIDHRMIALGDTVFALGGQHHIDGSDVDTIEFFNVNSESWTVHPTRLKSVSMSGLAVTGLPISAVSCNQGCQCGVPSTSRIIGGEDAEVISPQSQSYSCKIFCQAVEHPWLGLLLTEGETRANYSRCAATMVRHKNSFLFVKIFSSSQIGSNVFLTAAHCLENWAGEVQAPWKLKIILGVQNRRKLTSTARF